MHLLSINTELAFAVDNVNTSYFREQHPHCNPCAGPCLSQFSSHQEHLSASGGSHGLFLLSMSCSCPSGASASPVHIYPSEAQTPCLLSPPSPWGQLCGGPRALHKPSLKTKPCSGAHWQNPVLPVPDCIPSQSFLWFYHLQNPEVGSSAI